MKIISLRAVDGGLKMNKLRNLLLSGLVLVSVVGAAPALAAEPEPSVIHVTGYAEQELTPDMAYVTMSMETTESNAEAARVKNHAVMNQLSSSLKELGIPAADMKTLNYSLRPVYDQTSKKIVRYKVNNSLKVKVSELKLLGKVLAKGSECGVNRVSNIEFGCSRTAQVKAELISAAVANGRMVAQSAAQAAGSALGKVKEININGRFPVMQARNMDGVMLMKANAMADNEAPELEAGTQKVSESVEMTFYIE